MQNPISSWTVIWQRYRTILMCWWLVEFIWLWGLVMLLNHPLRAWLKRDPFGSYAVDPQFWWLEMLAHPQLPVSWWALTLGLLLLAVLRWMLLSVIMHELFRRSMGRSIADTNWWRAWRAVWLRYTIYRVGVSLPLLGLVLYLLPYKWLSLLDPTLPLVTAIVAIGLLYGFYVIALTSGFAWSVFNHLAVDPRQSRQLRRRAWSVLQLTAACFVAGAMISQLIWIAAVTWNTSLSGLLYLFSLVPPLIAWAYLTERMHLIWRHA